MEMNDVGEEGSSHCCRCVWVAEGDEMCVLGEVIHHRKYD
jgi:hypothetical protein